MSGFAVGIYIALLIIIYFLAKIARILEDRK